jgi:hypothetical protein
MNAKLARTRRVTAHAVRPALLQAESLRRTRRKHARETAEDYVEAIAICPPPTARPGSSTWREGSGSPM